jgi:hypothetical protein
MEPEASRAGIAAIAALQKRVRELEDEGIRLVKEHSVMKRRIRSRFKANADRETALAKIGSKTEEMLNGASSVMNDLREAQNETDWLESRLAETRQLLRSGAKKGHTCYRCSKRDKSALLNLFQKLREYEILLGDILRGPAWSLPLSHEDISILSHYGNDSDVLPPPLCDIHSELKGLPKDFKRQGLGKKRRIVRALRLARGAATEIHGRIKELEKKKYCSSTPRRYESAMKVLSIQLLLISNEMKLFRFE